MWSTMWSTTAVMKNEATVRFCVATFQHCVGSDLWHHFAIPVILHQAQHIEARSSAQIEFLMLTNYRVQGCWRKLRFKLAHLPICFVILPDCSHEYERDRLQS